MTGNHPTVTRLRDDEVRLLPAGTDGIGALTTERGNLPLTAVDISTRVTGLLAETVFSQTFRNGYDQALEATYLFTLPDRVAVTALRMEADGHVVEAELREREAARQVYDEAIAAGQRAAITEQERAEVFTMRVGNIAPGETVTVRLTTCGPLPYEDGSAIVRCPLVVAPRFVPGTPLSGPPVGAGIAPDTDAVPDASRITPPVLLPGAPNPVQLSLSLAVDPDGLSLNGIRSSLSTVEVTESDGEWLLRLDPGQRLDRDVVIRLDYGQDTENNSLTVVPDDSGSGGVFCLTAVPPSGPKRKTRPRDVVIVLDRSGSMGGWKMIAARRAAARIVDTLTARDSFAVLSFDNVVERPTGFSTGLLPAHDRNRFRAVEFLARTDARGGTEMLSPLREAVDMLRSEDTGRDRVLVLVTDGQVANETEILALFAPGARGIRVHAVGIDEAVNAGFLNRLAVAGGGRCELVESEDRLDVAMKAIHRRIGRPLVTGLRLEAADGGEFEPDTLAPERLPEMFDGVPWRITGRWRATALGAVRITGKYADGTEFSRTVAAPGDRQVSEHRSAVVAGWATDHLADLQDRYSSGGGLADQEALEKRIVATSLRYGVLSRFTAFVAVDSRPSVDPGGTRSVIQPVEWPAGWELPPAPGHGAPAPVMMRTMAFGGPPAPAPAFGAAPANPSGPPTHAPSPRRRFWARSSSTAPNPMAPNPFGGGEPEASGGGEAWRQATELFTEELARLADTATADYLDRCELLSDLASRLDGLVRHLSTHGVDDKRLKELRALIGPCRAAEDVPLSGPELEALWRQVIEVLENLRKE